LRSARALKAGTLALVLLLLLVPYQALSDVDHRQGEAWTAVRVLYAEGEQIQLNATSDEPIGIIARRRSLPTQFQQGKAPTASP